MTAVSLDPVSDTILSKCPIACSDNRNVLAFFVIPLLYQDVLQLAIHTQYRVCPNFVGVKLGVGG